jgi:serine/threonine protein kinase
MADIVSATPDFAVLIDEGGKTRQDKLMRTQKFLGPLPTRFAELLPGRVSQQSNVAVDTVGKLRTEIVQMRSMMLESDPGDDEMMKREDFSEEDLLSVSKLLKNMLNYEPEERCSAREALKSEFFKNTQ